MYVYIYKVSVSLFFFQECSEDVFLDGIFQPCLERGRLGALQGLLETLDPTLETWGRYLLSACQLLQRRGHYHSLYQLQQFMMVLKTYMHIFSPFLQHAAIIFSPLFVGSHSCCYDLYPLLFSRCSVISAAGRTTALADPSQRAPENLPAGTTEPQEITQLLFQEENELH